MCERTCVGQNGAPDGELSVVCIVCPNSCRLTVAAQGDEVVVRGAGCKRGEEHGRNEYVRPMRMVTTTVAISGAKLARLPVASRSEIPKDRLEECLEYLYRMETAAPVKAGDVVVENICGTGVDILATRSVECRG